MDLLSHIVLLKATFVQIHSVALVCKAIFQTLDAHRVLKE
jgi:hypothetical protein